MWIHWAIQRFEDTAPTDGQRGTYQSVSRTNRSANSVYSGSKMISSLVADCCLRRLANKVKERQGEKMTDKWGPTKYKSKETISQGSTCL